MRVHAVADDIRQIVESTAADEENVTRVDLDELLFRVFASPLRRHIHHRALQKLQQRLLHAFSRHITRNRRIFRTFTSNFVNFVDENDAAFGPLHIIVGSLQQTSENTLHILAHITRLRENSSVSDTERNIQQSGYCLGQQCFTRSRLPYHQDVGFLDIHIWIGFVITLQQALVMVVNRHGKHLFRLFLPNDIFIQFRFYFLGFQEFDLDFRKIFLLGLRLMLVINVHRRL